MSFLKKTAITYRLDTIKPKDEIISLLNHRIDNAKANKSWFSLEEINYKKVTVGINRMVIDKRGMSNYGISAKGAIIAKFKQTEDRKTIIEVEIKAIGTAITLWLVSLLMIFFSAINIWLEHSFNILFLLIPAWAVISAIIYLKALYNKNMLIAYTETILCDLDINEKFTEVKLKLTKSL